MLAFQQVLIGLRRCNFAYAVSIWVIAKTTVVTTRVYLFDQASLIVDVTFYLCTTAISFHYSTAVIIIVIAVNDSAVETARTDIIQTVSIIVIIEVVINAIFKV